MSDTVEQLEVKLDSRDADVRRSALQELVGLVESGAVEVAAVGPETNVHFHTFFSFNACWFSPSRVAWEAKKLGLASAGIVDFDVFDGLEEFYAACELLGVKGSVGMETRVFVPEFSEQVINSPGEPGVKYHMGTGFPSVSALSGQQAFCQTLRETAKERNAGLIERVNAYLDAIALDYDKDVLPLTPSGNATERHICLAYVRKARAVFADDGDLLNYWNDKLGAELSADALPEGADLLNKLRAKTMKQGGVGYVQPGEGSFPKLADVNAFIKAGGGIPTLTWLNGASDGEQDMERLFEVAMASGVAAVNIIPDRNYTPGLGESDQMCQNLYALVKMAQERDLPIIVGTEMNSPGLKIVDDFSSEELKPLTETFLSGALIVYAHSALQREAGLGYVSDWASENFSSVKEKNTFFEKVGEMLAAGDQKKLASCGNDSQPEEILNLIS